MPLALRMIRTGISYEKTVGAQNGDGVHDENTRADKMAEAEEPEERHFAAELVDLDLRC
jgi:hypothetical protein